MKLFNIRPFTFSKILSNQIFCNLLPDLPDIDFNLEKKNKVIKNKEDFDKFISENWVTGTYQLNQNEIAALSFNSSIYHIKNILKKWHNLKNKDLVLKSSCIFYPSKCNYSFVLDGQNYLYHKYHLDSGYKIKALISLMDSGNEEQQFSYIKKFPESIIRYYFTRHYFAKLVVFLHEILFYISFRKIRLSRQPPVLPTQYQDPKLYKSFDNLKKGEKISFHNLFPHSSHNGFSDHKSPMLQLVFDKC